MLYSMILICALVVLLGNNQCFSMSNMRLRRLQQRQISANERMGTATASLDELVLQQQSNENAAVFPVQASVSEKLDVITNNHINFYGFDDLFGNKMQFSELFDENELFRKELRNSIRNDLFVPSSTLSEAQNLALKDEKSTLMSSWRRPVNYVHLDETLRKYNINLDGNSFVKLITDLCGNTEYIFGSWIDIVGVKRRINHSWHQDSGLDQTTCMVGFPIRNCYEGCGVFSHAIKLSHRLPDHTVQEPRLWALGDIDERYVVRPTYKRGKEIMVYNDRDVFHSAPDISYRESIWRFM